MSETADHRTQTCQVRTKSGRLPDLARLESQVGQMQVGATLRGLEAVLAGQVEKVGDSLVLTVKESEERVRLVPLRRVVQWDLEKKREFPILRLERTAYDRLRRTQMQAGSTLEVTGPITQNGDTGEYSLEVRTFRIVPPRKAAKSRSFDDRTVSG